MEHYAPHPSSKFEGYYSKFDLPSGAHIALIICSVPNAQKHPPHMVSFTYYPKNGTPIFTREHYVKDIHRVTTDTKTNAFEIRVPGIGSMCCDADSTTTYDLGTDDWSFFATTTGRTSWDKKWETPEGWIVKFPLPLHWHVHSLASPCSIDLRIPSFEGFAQQDEHAKAIVHQEKNWANSFPSAHMWIQARSTATESTICLAGGKILGMTAYLLGYRSASHDVSFRPPFSLSILGISPFMSVDVDWEARSFSIEVSGWWRKLEMRARAPKERGWFGLAAPFDDGHRKNFLTESFLAEVEVKVFERSWPWLRSWREVKSEVFENASLEFGGEYFPERGEKVE